MQHLFLNIERSRRVGAGEFFPATPYIFCLSGNEDYLYFWSEYMKDANGDASAGGFSVGLDHRRLQAAIKDANTASGGCRFLLLPCLYARVDDACIADFFRAAYDHHRRSFDEFAAERDPLAHPSAAVMGVMLFAATNRWPRRARSSCAAAVIFARSTTSTSRAFRAVRIQAFRAENSSRFESGINVRSEGRKTAKGVARPRQPSKTDPLKNIF